LEINGLPKQSMSGEYTIEFCERDCNFREGGISTQYNFWKWDIHVNLSV